ncbi:hypothetical protein LWI28_018025 [Acer negundo]|uniref:DEK-C domain-containing protein n=1 Tax=Acer negundo TaxID=4023 RepID=A0AAD5NXR6_ACENE|nr:hypothetical protein LWI28_018025 [Acer negundo]
MKRPSGCSTIYTHSCPTIYTHSCIHNSSGQYSSSMNYKGSEELPTHRTNTETSLALLNTRSDPSIDRGSEEEVDEAEEKVDEAEEEGPKSEETKVAKGSKKRSKEKSGGVKGKERKSKGRGTALKDIPNVAFKLSRRKTDDTFRLLHSILFGRRGKAFQVKSNISRFSGFVWHENEEKQKIKVKEKFDKCNKEKLLEFCDVLTFQFPRTLGGRTKKVTVPKASPPPKRARHPKKAPPKRIKAMMTVIQVQRYFQEEETEEGHKGKKLQLQQIHPKEKSGKNAGKGKGKAKQDKVRPSDEELRDAICEILKEVDFNTATFTDILKQLATQFDTDLTSRNY